MAGSRGNSSPPRAVGVAVVSDSSATGRRGHLRSTFMVVSFVRRRRYSQSEPIPRRIRGFYDHPDPLEGLPGEPRKLVGSSETLPPLARLPSPRGGGASGDSLRRDGGQGQAEVPVVEIVQALRSFFFPVPGPVSDGRPRILPVPPGSCQRGACRRLPVPANLLRRRPAPSDRFPAADIFSADDAVEDRGNLIGARPAI